MTKFVVEIDGRPEAVIESSLDDAKREAIRRAGNMKSMKITVLHGGIVPSDAFYWDYEINDWVYNQNAAQVEAKGKES